MIQTDKDDKLTLSRAYDALAIAERSYTVKAVGFLNPHQRSLVIKNIYPTRDMLVSFEGGYPDAERTLYVCRPEYAEFDISDLISVIKISGRDLGGLTHRDYLGSLMGLGITRENIGDILVSDTGAFVFVKAEIADYIINNLDKIGRRGIKTEICACCDAAIPKPKYKEIKGTVSSTRLDSILSLAAGISRGRAVELIGQGVVSVNWEIQESVSARLGEGDLISVRGIGRMRVLELGGITRKGRYVITVAKYE